MDHIDTCVVGAGVVGLAIARSMALKGAETVVLDRESRFGEGVSSRNSEVIHAGIYYPAGSLKAESCVRGNRFRRLSHRPAAMEVFQHVSKLLLSHG